MSKGARPVVWSFAHRLFLPAPPSVGTGAGRQGNLFGACDLVIGIFFVVLICDSNLEKEISPVPLGVLLT
jgi:hypothetical protein